MMKKYSSNLMMESIPVGVFRGVLARKQRKGQTGRNSVGRREGGREREESEGWGGGGGGRGNRGGERERDRDTERETETETERHRERRQRGTGETILNVSKGPGTN